MKKKRIRLFYIFALIAAIAAVLAVFTLVFLGNLSTSVRTMQDITDEYIESQQAISSMREASNYLTEQAREYVMSGDTSHLEAYIEEVQVTKRRDEALDTLKQYQSDNESYQGLVDAVENSNQLAEVEMYAMRMASEAYEMSADDLERYFPGVALSDEDAGKAVVEKRADAVTMLFDVNYMDVKNTIMERSYDSLEKLIGNTRDRQIRSFERTNAVLRRADIMVIAILAATFFCLLLTALLVIIPLNRSVSYIREHKKLPVMGAAEYAYLAETYNSMMDKTIEHQEQLSYEATHDELTSLYNRKMFEEVRKDLDGEEIAMLLIDVDYFKNINDTYGHEIGDAVLKNVASILFANFRQEDYVCRIGGDEFCVIMKHMNRELQHVVTGKISSVREQLAGTKDLPAVTLSIGVAFSEDTDGDTYRLADLALYDVKEKGRNGYAFYTP